MAIEWVVAMIVGGAAAVSVARSLGRSLRHGRSWQLEVERRWRVAADGLGGILEVEAQGALSPRKLSLSAEIGEARVVAEVTVPADAESISHTRAHAAFVLGAGPRFVLREANATDAPALERTVLDGTPALSRRVRLTAGDPVATRAVWSEAAQKGAGAFPRSLSLRSDGERVHLVWDGVEMDERVLAQALALVAELSSAGVSTLRGLAGLDGATYLGDPDIVPAVRVRRGTAEVMISVVGRGASTRFEASAKTRRALPPFEALVGDDGAVTGDIPDGVVDPAAERSRALLGRCVLKARGDSLVVEFAEPPTEARAEAAVRLLAAVAGSTGEGVFR